MTHQSKMNWKFWKKFNCDQCKLKFSEYQELINHARHDHHHDIVKCTGCGKEFIHEEDRLHHVRKEHDEKMFGRIHKYGNKQEKKSASTQDEVDKHTGHFSDNF